MDKLLKFFTSIVAVLFDNISPELRDFVQDFVKQLWTKAKATDNPFDDIVVKLLAGVFDVSLE